MEKIVFPFSQSVQIDSDLHITVTQRIPIQHDLQDLLKGSSPVQKILCLQESILVQCEKSERCSFVKKLSSRPVLLAGVRGAACPTPKSLQSVKSLNGVNFFWFLVFQLAKLSSPFLALTIGTQRIFCSTYLNLKCVKDLHFSAITDIK